MNNAEMLVVAIQALDKVNPKEVETVQINHTIYDNGSRGLSVEITYPETEKPEG